MIAGFSDDELERIAGMTIKIDDIRRAGHCVKGAREWFARHDIDFRTFISHGISAREFLEKGDALSARIVRVTMERRNG